MSPRALLMITFMLVVMAVSLSAESAQIPHLRVSVSGSSSKNTAPRIEIIAGRQEIPSYDIQSRTWRVPLRQNTNGYFSPYLLSLSEASEAVPVQMNFPVFLIEQDQVVHLSVPSIKAFDEIAIREIWSDPERSNQDPHVQFRFLHDLLYVNKRIQMEQGIYANATARSTRAAMMLLQTIDSLRQKTWYVIGSDTQSIVDNAIKTVRGARRQEKICRWLGVATCANRDVDALINRVRGIDSYQLTKVYSFIYPDGATPTLSFCNERIQKMSAFLDHIAGLPNLSSPSLSRVAQELAACHATRALCKAPSIEYSISELNSAEVALRRIKSNEQSWRNRLDDVQRARSVLQKGGLAVCPANRFH